MGAILRTLCRPAIRSLLLALLAASAWLVWGAGTATASSLVPDGGDLLEPASSLLAEPLPAPPAVVSAGEAAGATATSLTDTAPLTDAASLADAATATVNTLAAPVLPVAAGTVDSVTALAPGLPDLPLVQAPLPLPLTDVLPLPEQLPPLLPEPGTLPLPLPDLLPVPGLTPVPGLPPLTTPAPGSVPAAAPSLPASDAVADSGHANLSAAAGTAAGPADPAAGSSTVRFGFAPAQDRAGVASPPEATASRGPDGDADNPGRLDPPALANQAGTASSGSAGGFDGAADLGGTWPALPAAANSPHLSGAETLPAGPSFDPGSSPD